MLAPLLALALVVVQAAATAHELEHSLHAHDKSSCVLHLYAEHGGGVPTPDVVIASAVTSDSAYTPCQPTVVFLTRTFDYQVRAPPFLCRNSAV